MAEVSFGEWLKRRRSGLGLTQDQLALQINCSTSALRKFESEERRPSAETIEMLADIFNIPPEERKSFLRFARGDWQAFQDVEIENSPWRFSKIDPQSSLPSLLTSFIGRKKEQREIIDLLKKNRLVTLAGAGGIGKTRFAIEAGHQLLTEFPHGVWFVPLDSITDPQRVSQTVASVFGIREGMDRLAVEALKNYLLGKNLLLILDNCEHLLDACTQLIKTLLAHCPNLRILTTSREILNIEGEASYFLPSLSIPESNASLEILSESESIQLFVDRAALVLSKFQLTKENAQAIIDICTRVDGIPLAIELIVARVNILKLDEISKQLEKSFSIVANSNRTMLTRHQTLRASIDWSWSLLTDAEQVFLRQLSVFAGGWTLESAQAVCDGDALHLTSSLAQKSLIIVQQDREYETRYHFHETLCQYAHEKLAELGELEALRARHLKYFLELSEKIESEVLGIKQEEWYARAVDERDNLHAALELAAKTDIEAGLTLSARLEAVWERYEIREGTFWLAEFLQKPESDQYPLARARALCAQSMLLVWLEKFPQARLAAEESLALFRACHDQMGEIDALTYLGASYFYLKDRAEGIKYIEQALALSQSLGDIWRQAKVYEFLGWYHNDSQRSIANREKAIFLYSKVGDHRSQVLVLNWIALLQVLDGEIELAKNYLDRARQLLPLSEMTEGWGDYQVTKSIISLEQGDYEQARTLLQEVILQSEKSGNQFDFLWAKARLGHLALRQGNISEARKIFVETAVEFQKTEKIGVVYSLEGMAGVYAATGSPVNAVRLIGWGDATRKNFSDLRPLLEQREVDKIITACISQMGEIAFADAFDEGQGMTMDEAVDLSVNPQQPTL